MEPLREGDPSVIGPFRLVGHRGGGGFGTVYVGYRPDSPEPAAVKLLNRNRVSSPVWRGRFAQEVEAIRKAGGVFTASLIDANPDAGLPWLATAYIAAPSLGDLVARYGCVGGVSAWWLLASLTEALQHIHSVGLLHRDLKPGNVMVTGTGVRLIDFGISRVLNTDTITSADQTAGSYYYSAPEQFTSSLHSATPRSDVYSVGATMVYATAQHAPYRPETESDWRQGVLPDLDGVPSDLTGLLASCLAGDPARRPTVSDLLDVAAEHLLAAGVAPSLDRPPPLEAQLTAAIARSEQDEAAPPSPFAGGQTDFPDSLPGEVPDHELEYAGSTAARAVGGGGYRADAFEDGFGDDLGDDWNAWWDRGLDDRRNRYEG